MSWTKEEFDKRNKKLNKLSAKEIKGRLQKDFENADKKLVYEDKTENGDYMKFWLCDPPLIEVDDVAVEIYNANFERARVMGFMDWEMLIFMRGFTEVLLEKYGSLKKAFETWEERGQVTWNNGPPDVEVEK